MIERSLRDSDDLLLAAYEAGEHLRMLELMHLIRCCAEEAAARQGPSPDGWLVRLGVGEEASVVGAVAALRAGDYLIGAGRTHGHALARGAEPVRVMAGLLAEGSAGVPVRGGRLHLSDARRRWLGGEGVVAGHLPLAVGIGLAIAYLAQDAVVMCVFDGTAADDGAFHESLELGRRWELPVVWVCVDDGGAAVGRAAAYGLPAARVDRLDVLAVRRACEVALERARQERLASLVGCVGERAAGRGLDPIERYRRRLVEAGHLTGQQAGAVARAVAAAAARAAALAERGADPELADLPRDVYADDAEP